MNEHEEKFLKNLADYQKETTHWIKNYKNGVTSAEKAMNEIIEINKEYMEKEEEILSKTGIGS